MADFTRRTIFAKSSAYAAARHITIVPEIEMPGHSLAALTAYPQFGYRRRPFTDSDAGWCQPRHLFTRPRTEHLIFWMMFCRRCFNCFPANMFTSAATKCPEVLGIMTRLPGSDEARRLEITPMNWKAGSSGASKNLSMPTAKRSSAGAKSREAASPKTPWSWIGSAAGRKPPARDMTW